MLPALLFSAVVVVGLALAGCAAPGIRPVLSNGNGTAGWSLSEGCRVYEFGILTAPDCDILNGRGIAIQITRVRILDSRSGPDSRSTIGIEFHPEDGNWSFSAPYATLLINGGSYTPTDVDEAIVFAKGDRAIPERLPPRQLRYELPPHERRFLRLRFAVPQNELGKGFALRVTGLHAGGEDVRVPLLEFEAR